MKKNKIIKSSNEFTKIIKTSKYLKNSNFIIYYQKNDTSNRYGISVPKKIGKANVRNKIKRRIKNIIDINEFSIQKTFNYVIIIRKGLLELSYKEIEISLLSLLKKIGDYDEK